MCIIIAKPENTPFPKKEYLQNSFVNNDDGCGFMFAHDGTVEYHKGFMKFRSFYKALNKCRKKYGDDIAYVMHFRISTAGGVKQSLCHPFEISDEYKQMRSLDKNTTNCCVMHNGILHDFNPTFNDESDLNDTMKFTKQILVPLFNIVDWKKVNKFGIDTLLEPLIDNNKFAILKPNGELLIINRKLWVEEDGVLYSNNTYSVDYQWSNYGTNYYSNYGSYSNYYSNHDYYPLTNIETKTDKPENIFYLVNVYSNLKKVVVKEYKFDTEEEATEFALKYKPLKEDYALDVYCVEDGIYNYLFDTELNGGKNLC